MLLRLSKKLKIKIKDLKDLGVAAGIQQLVVITREDGYILHINIAPYPF